jgi:hypothetical protein
MHSTPETSRNRLSWLLAEIVVRIEQASREEAWETLKSLLPPLASAAESLGICPPPVATFWAKRDDPGYIYDPIYIRVSGLVARYPEGQEETFPLSALEEVGNTGRQREVELSHWPAIQRRLCDMLRSWSRWVACEPPTPSSKQEPEPHTATEPASGEGVVGPAPVQYVTLNQVSALLKRSKKTFERRKKRPKNPLPDPDVPGGGGKSDEWIWATLRPWLQEEFNHLLPERFPDLNYSR